jgi:hypothetical protein
MPAIFLQFVNALSASKTSTSSKLASNANRPCAAVRWRPEEDAALINAVTKYGARNWKSVAAEVASRNNVQCAQRWLKALKPGLQKGHWKPQEDSALLMLVQEHGTNWPKVAENWSAKCREGEAAQHSLKTPGGTAGTSARTIKQIRERWNNHVNPTINTACFTPEEDQQVIALQLKWGNSWSKIAKCLPGRVGEAVKSRFKTLARRNDQRTALCSSVPRKKLRKLEVSCSKLEGSLDPVGLNDAISNITTAASLMSAASGCGVRFEPKEPPINTSSSTSSQAMLLAMAGPRACMTGSFKNEAGTTCIDAARLQPYAACGYGSTGGVGRDLTGRC